MAIPLQVISTTLLAAAPVINVMQLCGGCTVGPAVGLPEQIVRTAQSWSPRCAMLLIRGYLTKTSDDF